MGCRVERIQRKVPLNGPRRRKPKRWQRRGHRKGTLLRAK